MQQFTTKEILLDSYDSIAGAVAGIKTHDEVTTALAEHEKVMSDALDVVLTHALGLPEVIWNYTGTMSYCTRGISVWMKSSEQCILTFCTKHGMKFSSAARAKLAGVACVLHDMFSTRALHIAISEEDVSPAKATFLGTALHKSSKSMKEYALAFSRDLTCLEEIKDVIAECKRKAY